MTLFYFIIAILVANIVGSTIYILATKPCPECRGLGVIVIWNNTSASCPTCNHSGRVSKKTMENWHR